MSHYPSTVKIVEVGPRDGLQNEAKTISVADKIKYIQLLAEAGLTYIEAGAFVSPKWVPQMADTEHVLAALDLKGLVTYAVLVPNMKGMEAAIAAGVRDVAVFAAASESFSQKNINCSIDESIERFLPVISHRPLLRASAKNWPISAAMKFHSAIRSAPARRLKPGKCWMQFWMFCPKKNLRCIFMTPITVRSKTWTWGCRTELR